MLSLFSIIIFSFPSFATDPDIAANVTNPVCNSGVLDTDSGSVDLEIQWEPNTINVKWYNDTEENGATTPSTTNTCTYDGALTVPVAPAKKTGYTFAGWRLRQQPRCEFPSILADSPGEVDIYRDGAIVWSGIGTVMVNRKCSDTNGGTRGTIGNPSDVNGKYCWCAATAWLPDNGTQCNIETPVWVFSYADEDFSECETYCRGSCRSYSAVYYVSMFGQ